MKKSLHILVLLIGSFLTLFVGYTIGDLIHDSIHRKNNRTHNELYLQTQTPEESYNADLTQNGSYFLTPTLFCIVNDSSYIMYRLNKPHDLPSATLIEVIVK